MNQSAKRIMPEINIKISKTRPIRIKNTLSIMPMTLDIILPKRANKIALGSNPLG
ncbi:hypothetical protein HY249_02605 [Candidatus Azambacteria bacterium]|nr:hypothetical protein [Candidatus Azambacteria bacterium]